MTSDAIRPFGDEGPEARAPRGLEPWAIAEPLASGTRAASKFVGRVSRLDAQAVAAVVNAWHQLMRVDSERWFAAENAAGDAVVSSRRTAEQEVLLGHLADGVLRGVWYRDASGRPPRTPEARVGATEASAQYVAAVAMLAVLVRDHLSPTDFALLYRPFAVLIPLAELAPE